MDKRELTDLGITSWNRLRRAIEEGDKSEALKLLDIVAESTQRLRAVLTDAIDISLTALAEHSGEQAVYQAVREFCVRDVKPFIGADFGNLSAAEKLKRRARLWTEGHGIPIELEEDAEKYILRVPCDTGGLIVSRDNFGKTTRAYPWSGGLQGVGYYCTHCPISFELMAVEEGGRPWWITLPPREAGEKCTQYIFKDDAAMPDVYYERLGLGKTLGQ